MATLRNETNKNFTIINNYILHRTDVSLKAIGMYAKMVSLPDNWNFTETGLCTICKDGKDSVRSSLKELEDIGLLFRFQIKEKGKFGNCIYYISSVPMTEDEKREILGRYNPINALVVEKVDELSLSENPISEKTISENQAQLNTNILNTKEYNNRPSKKEDFTTKQLEELTEHFNLTWNEYPNKRGKAKAIEYFFEWIKGRKISGTTIKLTDKQMYFAVMNYKKECEDNKTEIKYIKHGDTFFNKAILDYVEEE